MGMVVPITPGSKQGMAMPQQQPSQTDLLMALAEMHKQGRFTKSESKSEVD